MFAADFGKDLNALVGEEGIQGSLGEHLGYRLLATVQVVMASYHERSWCWLHGGEGQSWYLQFSPLGQLTTSWWERKASFPPGKCFLMCLGLWLSAVSVVTALLPWAGGGCAAESGLGNAVVSIPLLNWI